MKSGQNTKEWIRTVKASLSDVPRTGKIRCRKSDFESATKNVFARQHRSDQGYSEEDCFAYVFGSSFMEPRGEIASDIVNSGIEDILDGHDYEDVYGGA